MKRTALYSRATHSRGAGASPWHGRAHDQQSLPAGFEDFDSGPSFWQPLLGWCRRYYARHPQALLVAASVLITLAIVGAFAWLMPRPRVLTQSDIDAAVKYTLSNTPRAPADAARAAALIQASVVEIEGFLSPEHAAELARAAKKAHRQHSDKSADTSAPDEPQPDSIGSGVVVTESGTILTALHVVTGTDRWTVVFADGSKSDAKIVGSQPENDLAVLQASRVPDEQPAAVLASTAGLKPGDTVVATGFPFGIGPSVTAGVVSGLRREFDDPHSHRKLTNLIQFDAAVNPGNSGGPLVDRDGQVVGIVTALLNPSDADVFAGIGFAVPIENAATALGDNPL